MRKESKMLRRVIFKTPETVQRMIQNAEELNAENAYRVGLKNYKLKDGRILKVKTWKMIFEKDNEFSDLYNEDEIELKELME